MEATSLFVDTLNSNSRVIQVVDHVVNVFGHVKHSRTVRSATCVKFLLRA